MKLVGLVGSNADKSYNRSLLQFIEKKYNDLFDLEILEIADVPLFNQSKDQTNSDAIQHLNKKISEADGVIIATPEHNRTVPPALKSVIEWLSFKVHPFQNQPVLIVGASYFDQGTSRAQLHLRQILEAPGVGAFTFPGNEFLLSFATKAFDENNNLKDQKTVEYLRSVLEKFCNYVEILKGVERKEAVKLKPEDLLATGKIDTTIEGLDMYAEDWVEQASAKVKAAKGSDYVELNRGVLTVDQLNHLLNSMPFEITYADSNNQFLYYNNHIPREEMLAKRHVSQPGNPLGACHPESTHKNVSYVIQELRAGHVDHFRVKVPTHGPDKFVVHTYQGLYDEDGSYLGINEYVQDIQPLIDWYLEQTGQELVGGKTDGVSGASANDSDTDGVSGATDGVSGASANDSNTDGVSGATANGTNTSITVDGMSGATESEANVPDLHGSSETEADAVSGASES